MMKSSLKLPSLVSELLRPASTNSRAIEKKNQQSIIVKSKSGARNQCRRKIAAKAHYSSFENISLVYKAYIWHRSFGFALWHFLCGLSKQDNAGWWANDCSRFSGNRCCMAPGKKSQNSGLRMFSIANYRANNSGASFASDFPFFF